MKFFKARLKRSDLEKLTDTHKRNFTSKVQKIVDACVACLRTQKVIRRGTIVPEVITKGITMHSQVLVSNMREPMDHLQQLRMRTCWYVKMLTVEGIQKAPLGPSTARALVRAALERRELRRIANEEW